MRARTASIGLALLLGAVACEEPAAPPGPTPIPRPPGAPTPAPVPAPPSPPPAPPAPAPATGSFLDPCPPPVVRAEVPDDGAVPSFDGPAALLVHTKDAATGATLPSDVWVQRRSEELPFGAAIVPRAEPLHLTLPAAPRLTVCVTSAGYETVCVRRLGLVAGGTLPVEVTLRRRRTVSGRVLDAAGAPVVDAAVLVVAERLDDMPHCQITTDATGRFVCEEAVDGPYRVEVRPAGVDDMRSMEIAVRDALPAIELRLPPTAALTVRATFPRSTPSDVMVTVRGPHLNGADLGPSRPTMRRAFFVDPEDRWPEEGPVTVESNPLEGRASIAPTRLAAIHAGEEIELPLRVRWRPNPSYREGQWGRIRADWKAPRGAALVAPLEPAEPPVLVGRLVDPFGEPVERFHLRSRELDRVQRCSQDHAGETDERWGGAGFLWPWAVGHYAIEVWTDDGRLGRAEVTTTAHGGRQVFTLRLERPAGVKGRFVDARTGLPVPPTRLAFDGHRFSPSSTFMADDGRWLILPVEPGEHFIGPAWGWEQAKVRSCPGVLRDTGELALLPAKEQSGPSWTGPTMQH